MIDVKGLCLGNLLLIDGDIATVESIHSGCLYYSITDNDKKISNVSSAISDFEPIPLNNKWLAKLGFYPHGRAWGKFVKQKQGGVVDFIFEFGALSITVTSLKSGMIDCKHIQYVHQLQNLVYALIGESLEIR